MLKGDLISMIYSLRDLEEIRFAGRGSKITKSDRFLLIIFLFLGGVFLATQENVSGRQSIEVQDKFLQVQL